MSIASQIKIAVVQDAPAFLDKSRTVQKICQWIQKAGAEGAQLIVFPEAFVSAYPDWVWVVPSGKKALINDLYRQLWETAVYSGDPALEEIGKAARKAKIYVALGVNERNSEASNASLFNSLLFFDAGGKLLGKHRKLIPTGGERLMWAMGDGSTLNAFDTPIGKLGGLICWENYMPLARAAMYAKGVQIYLAPTWDSSPVWLATMQHVAKEAGAFVVGCCMALHREDIPDSLEFKHLYPAEKEWINVGNSCVVSPAGKFVLEPVARKKGMFFAELDFSEIPASKWILDSAGHYTRPDIFQLIVDTRPRNLVDMIKE